MVGRWMVCVCVLGFLCPGGGEESCRVQDGKPGEAGLPGVDGRDGAKGQKGESAPAMKGDPHSLLAMKGASGNRGPPGDMGPKGYRGDLGPEGVAGPPGPMGPPGGENAGKSQSVRSAFSVVRTDTSFSKYNEKITFQKPLFNLSPDFNMTTGLFTCKEPGVYYFVFHSMAKADMCVALRSSSEALPKELGGFCDYSNKRTSQVLSGGVVLSLSSGQKVWLEMFKDKQPDSTQRDTADKQIVFNGFLIFSTA